MGPEILTVWPINVVNISLNVTATWVAVVQAVLEAVVVPRIPSTGRLDSSTSRNTRYCHSCPNGIRGLYGGRDFNFELPHPVVVLRDCRVWIGRVVWGRRRLRPTLLK
jgi:hypothetical protein